MKIEIVTHSYNYSRLLTYQLSSLALHPPQDVSLTFTVFYNEDDLPTRQVLDFFWDDPRGDVAVWNFRNLPTPELCRRAIGRNLAALNSHADWIWFTDCDYIFGPGALDSLPEALGKIEGPLAFPRQVLGSISHELGDAAIQKVNGPGLYSIDPTHFRPARHNRAIGGIQIVRGDVAREIGYCRGTRWQRPARTWKRTHEDRAFRKILGTRGEPIDIPNVFRIRHSLRGRKHKGVEL